MYNHSRRVFWFGSLQGRNRGLSFDPELLYIGAMFHDLGLNEQFRGSGRRFEVDSANEARRFLQGHGVPEDSIRRVWTAIALHTTPGIRPWSKNCLLANHHLKDSCRRAAVMAGRVVKAGSRNKR